ncbi:MAG TPA: RNA polymerase sigma-70 factor [Chitinophagaceae bacterium]|nr:RNA polymerase sigma-70 factor [Chitinophagaceae bacterium]
MQTEKKYEESELLSLLAQDSEYAFQLVFDRYRNHTYKVAMMYVKSPVIAEEIVQDVFLKLWYQRKNLADIRSLENWLFTLTRNLTFNCLKKIAHEWTAREKWVEQNFLSENTTDHKTLNKEYQQLLQQAISHLSEQQQQVFKFGKEEGLSYDAISKRLSISPLTVKTHMARALAFIRLFFQQHSELFMLFIILSAKNY